MLREHALNSLVLCRVKGDIFAIDKQTDRGREGLGSNNTCISDVGVQRERFHKTVNIKSACELTIIRIVPNGRLQIVLNIP